jgi:hypothetical protein
MSGPAGSGHAAKALNNLLSATNLAAAAEILTVAASVGIAPATMLQVINGSTGRSQATEVKYPRHVLTGTFDSGFAMDLMSTQSQSPGHIDDRRSDHSRSSDGAASVKYCRPLEGVRRVSARCRCPLRL